MFAYGTLELPELMEALTGARPDSSDAVLDGYERFLLRGRVYPGIVEAGGRWTHGRLYHPLDAAALARHLRQDQHPVLIDESVEEGG